MVLNLLTYPDKRLFQKSKIVTKFDDDLHRLLDDMYETMHFKNGIGLAAIQVGVAIRVLVINLLNEDGVQDKNDLLEIINPKIISKDGEIIYQEGCLSVPGFYEDVKRANRLTLSYQDRYANEKILEADELLAVCIQHEMDHLDGHLFIEKIGYTKRKKFDKEFKQNLKKSRKIQEKPAVKELSDNNSNLQISRK